jgi:hypothetical protein
MHNIVIIVMIVFLALATLDSEAKSVILDLDNHNVSTHTDSGDSLRALTVLKFELPKELVGKRVDSALLEFYTDVSLVGEAFVDHSPVIEVYPLTKEFQGNETPSYARSRAVRNINLGEVQSVKVDVTDIVRDWLSGVRANHGLIVGSLSGGRAGDFALRQNALDDGVLARVRIHYQERFGNRVRH